MPVVVRHKGKVVGVWDNEIKVFSKSVDSKKHRLWERNAYGIQDNIVAKLAAKGCQIVEITEKDTGDIYVSDFSEWLDCEVEDLGHGKQCFLSVDSMRKLYGKENNTTKQKPALVL